jgi:hypothetical protein
MKHTSIILLSVGAVIVTLCLYDAVKWFLYAYFRYRRVPMSRLQSFRSGLHDFPLLFLGTAGMMVNILVVFAILASPVAVCVALFFAGKHFLGK